VLTSGISGEQRHDAADAVCVSSFSFMCDMLSEAFLTWLPHHNRDKNLVYNAKCFQKSYHSQCHPLKIAKQITFCEFLHLMNDTFILLSLCYLGT